MASESTQPKVAEGWVVKFVPFSSSVNSAFWVRYCREKLETIKLSESPIEIQTSYGVEGPSRLTLQEGSLGLGGVEFAISNERVSMRGSLKGFNTLEDFQKSDKNQLLHDSFCEPFFEGDLSCLTSMALITHAELKNHKVLYWFGMPALMTRSGRSIRATKQVPFENLWSAEERQHLGHQLNKLRLSQPSLSPFFLCTKNSCAVLSKDAYAELLAQDEGDVIFGFFDPTGPNPIQPQQPMGWPMRNLVAYLSHHLDLGGKTVQILSYRSKRLTRILPQAEQGDTNATLVPTADQDSMSIMLSVSIPTKEDYEWDTPGNKHRVVGWELNARNKPGPRWVNLRPLLDSNHLAIQAADLNLKLMKWRMFPSLDINLLQNTKVLLVGAGTLGCNVARVLLGWGIRNFKIIDYGNVSYSNPVRQSLFTLDDCHANNGTGRPKAAAAAEALGTIAADVNSSGTVLSIPMPGHSSESKESITTTVETLDGLVQECDAVFLLTDTRESRWLPTLMAAAYDKVLINAALGPDSWLVMRHGGGMAQGASRLGCYFCNDVVAPENSTKNRTLDQQCTVTRPGLAPIASSMAVELMVSMLHHPKRQAAPAPTSTGAFSPVVSQQDSSSSGPLGVIPHQIRGSLVSYTMMNPTVPCFVNCTACAVPVIEAYKKDKIDLVYNTCMSVDGSYLENVSGLTEFRAKAAEKIETMEDWDFDEDED